MKLARLMLVACALVSAVALAGCSSDMNGNAGNANANAAASPSPAVQTLSEVERPQKVKEMMAARGEEDNAAPKLKIVEPKDGATVSGPTVKLKLELSGDLKGYQPHKDPSTGTGNHVHVILDNQPYEAYYNLGEPFELRNVAGFTPALVMDVWEHAFLLDYKPAERPKYIEAFFSNIDWAAVEDRLAQGSTQARSATNERR